MHQPVAKRPSVLLGSASSGGTLATVRHLAKYDIDVALVVNHPLGAAAWSRFVSKRHAGPLESDNARYLDRLVAIGKADPGQLLLPTSDELVWLYTCNSALLERYFRLYQPSIDTIQRILDKARFEQAATRAGLAVLPSWDPQNADELAALAPCLQYPVLIKPRTHVHRARSDKGLVVTSPEELLVQYQNFLAREKYSFDNAPRSPSNVRPIIQQFVQVGREGVVSVSGFIARSADAYVTRQSAKVLQRSRPVGVGVCYEARPSDPVLSEAVYRLCRELDYFGIFEVEFIRFRDRWATIDFNPRIFNQIGLDLHRGMPLPLLAYLDALGDTKGLDKLVTQAEQEQPTTAAFSDNFTLHAILLAQALCLQARPKDLAYWRAWAKTNRPNMVHFAADRTDPMPAFIHVLSEMYLGFRAAPRFVKAMLPSSPLMARGL